MNHMVTYENTAHRRHGEEIMIFGLYKLGYTNVR